MQICENDETLVLVFDQAMVEEWSIQHLDQIPKWVKEAKLLQVSVITDDRGEVFFDIDRKFWSEDYQISGFRNGTLFYDQDNNEFIRTEDGEWYCVTTWTELDESSIALIADNTCYILDDLDQIEHNYDDEVEVYPYYKGEQRYVLDDDGIEWKCSEWTKLPKMPPFFRWYYESGCNIFLQIQDIDEEYDDEWQTIEQMVLGCGQTIDGIEKALEANVQYFPQYVLAVYNRYAEFNWLYMRTELADWERCIVRELDYYFKYKRPISRRYVAQDFRAHRLPPGYHTECPICGEVQRMVNHYVVKGKNVRPTVICGHCLTQSEELYNYTITY